MSITEELTKLDDVRDALVVSINNKGGELPEDATLWQVKKAVDNITVTVPDTTATTKTMLNGYTAVVKDTTDSSGYKVITGEIITASTVEVENELEFNVETSYQDTSAPPSNVLEDYTISGRGVSVLTSSLTATAKFNAHFIPGTGDVLVLNSTIPGYFEYNSYAEKTIKGPAYIKVICSPRPEKVGATITEGGRFSVEGPLLVGKITVSLAGDLNFKAENIKKGVTMWNITGTLEVPVPVVPDTCVAYLGSNKRLYVKQDSGISVIGLTQDSSDREGWDAYRGFSNGVLAGSVVSQRGVYLQWEGFKDLNKKWTVHSVMNSGYKESSESNRIGWGFDLLEDEIGSYDSTLGYGIDTFGISLRTRVWKQPADASNISPWWDFPSRGTGWRDISPVHNVCYGCSWDGNGQTANSKLYYYGDHSLPSNINGQQQLFYPAMYDSEMGGYMSNATSYSLGDKLYLGNPVKCDVDGAQSGVMILNFALELSSYGSGNYYSPFFTGAYKNL